MSDARKVRDSVVPSSHSDRDSGASGRLWSPWVAIALTSTWGLVLVRAIPVPRGDRGIFVSVAERLLAGDRLYADVWDNKDPLFYFLTALGRSVSPYSDVVIEVAWILSSSIAVLTIARWLGCGSASAVFVSFGMAPIIITGALYYPGYTHLPGTALTLLMFAALTSNRFALAGVLFGSLVFMKLVILPVAAALIVTYFVFRRTRAGAFAMALGIFGPASVMLIFLAIRGELGPYFYSLIMNVSYSKSLVIDSNWGPVVTHLASVLTAAAATVILVVVAVLASEAARKPQDRVGGSATATKTIWLCTLASLATGLVVLALTGHWDHHAQILYVPAILASLMLVRRSDSVAPLKSLPSVLALLSVALLLSGSSPPTAYVRSIRQMPSALAELAQLSDKASGLLSVGDSGTYARVGMNDDGGHAYGLRMWHLECPRFHQYPFEPEDILGDVASCLPNADVIVVSSSAVPRAEYPAWNRYLGDVEELLSSRYDCSAWESKRICVRVDMHGDNT